MPKYVAIWTDGCDSIQEAETPEQAVNQFVDCLGLDGHEQFYAIEITDDTPVYQLRAARMITVHEAGH
jgi:hypothetical protein